VPSLAPSLPPSSFCAKARQQLGTFSGMFWTLSLCCLVRKGVREGGREGGRVEIRCDSQDVLISSSLPPSLPPSVPRPASGGVRHDLTLQQHCLFFAAGAGKEGGKAGGREGD
jgi:hypothetical protein